MAQPPEEMADRSQQVGRAVSILDVGGVHLGANQMTAGIGNDVTLAPIDLLARIISPRPSTFRGLDRLTVDHPCRRAGFAALPLPSGFSPHLASPVPSDAACASQDAEIAQFISGQTLRQSGDIREVLRGDANPVMVTPSF